MDDAALKFEVGRHIRWDEDHDGMAFEGISETGTVQFVATAEALAFMLDPDRGHIDALTCAEVFAGHETELHAIAQKLYGAEGAAETVLILREDIKRHE